MHNSRNQIYKTNPKPQTSLNTHPLAANRSLFRLAIVGLLVVIPSGCQSIKKLSTHAPEPTLLTLSDLNAEAIQKFHSERHEPSSDAQKFMNQKAGFEPDPEKLLSGSSKKSSRTNVFSLPVSELTLSQALTYFRRYELKELMTTSLEVDRTTCNFNPNASYAIASHSERYFPNELAREIAETNYKHAIKCGASETLEQARYRHGLLKIAFSNSCDDAIPVLQDLKDDQATRPAFKVRAAYWIQHCKSQLDPETTKFADLELLNQFPLSHHALILVGLTQPAPVLSGSPTEIESQTQSFRAPLELFQETMAGEVNPYSLDRTINDWLWFMESAYIKNDFRGLSRILHAFAQLDFATGRKSADPVLDSRVLLYASHFAHINSDYLPLFQLVSKAIHLEPRFRSRDVMARFFPLAFDGSIASNSRDQDLDINLIRGLIRQESAFNPSALSVAGARGLMQIIPHTARRLDRSASKSQLMDPSTNIRLGTKYLRQLIHRFNGDHRLALAAYNAGASKVEDWMRRYPTQNMQLLVDLFPYRETREYVASIERNRFWYRLLYPTEHIARPSLSELSSPTVNRDKRRLVGSQNSKQIEKTKSLKR